MRIMKIIEAVKSSARIVTNAGLVLVGSILEKAAFHEKCNILPVAVSHPENQISCGDVFATAIGMMCSGNHSFESCREFDDDKAFYQDALGIKRVPSAERLRQRLDQAALEEESRGLELHKGIRDMNLSLLKQENARVSALPMGDVPVDCDVTPYEESKSHKEGVNRTYKGFDGYAPMDAHIGTEGHFVNTDFREGKQHSQKGSPAFLIETIDLCNQLTDRTLLFRMDSGNDAVENIGIIMERGHHFIIKRNPRSESKEDWLTLAEENAPIHQNTHGGQEFDLIMEGRLKVKIGEHTEVLGPGDSIFYNSSTPHGMIAVDGADCVFCGIIPDCLKEMSSNCTISMEQWSSITVNLRRTWTWNGFPPENSQPTALYMNYP